MEFNQWLPAKLGCGTETQGHDMGRLIAEFLQEKHGLQDEDFVYDGKTISLADRGVPKAVGYEAANLCHAFQVGFNRERY